jgi:hypothetical protein
VTAAFDFDDVDRVLTISGEGVVLQISVGEDDLAQVGEALHAEWTARQSIRVGHTLGTPVHWSRGDEPDTVNLMVGPDDETWQVLVVVPASLIRAIADSPS